MRYHFINCINSSINHAHFQHCLDCDMVFLFKNNNYSRCYNCKSMNTTHIAISGTDEDLNAMDNKKYDDFGFSKCL